MLTNFNHDMKILQVPDIMAVARVDHVYQVLFTSTPSNQFITHGLVSLVPRPVGVGNDSILVGRGYLHRRKLISR